MNHAINSSKYLAYIINPWCWRRESNTRPTNYELAALPLSYTSFLFELKARSRIGAARHSFAALVRVLRFLLELLELLLSHFTPQFGTPGEIRTPINAFDGLQIRSLLLYPVKLRA